MVVNAEDKMKELRIGRLGFYIGCPWKGGKKGGRERRRGGWGGRRNG